MSRTPAAGIPLLVTTAWLTASASTGSQAQESLLAARGEVTRQQHEDALRTDRSREMDTWLRRLVGRYRVEGLGDPLDAPAGTSVPAMADCTAIGAGAGVHCIIGWIIPAEERYSGAGESGRTKAAEADAGQINRIVSMYQFGMDPVASRIRFMRAESPGSVMEGSGTLSNGTMRSRMRCPDSASHPPCESVVVIAPAPGGQVITMTSYVTSGGMQYLPSARFSWHRVEQEPDEMGSGAVLELIQSIARESPLPDRPTSRPGRRSR